MTQDRDTAVERLLRQAMREDARPAGPCLDADTLAAWSDGGLSGKALAAAEAHAASCVRCQAVLAAMARTAEIGDGLDSQDAVASTTAAGIFKGVRWLVPLAGAAAAAALVIAIWPGARVEDLGRAPAAPPASAPKQVAEPESTRAPAALADKADAPAKTAPADTRAADEESGERRKVADEKAKNEKKVQTQELDQLQARARAFRQDEAQNKVQKAAEAQTQQNANQIANQAQSPAPMQNVPQSQTQVTQSSPPVVAPAARAPVPARSEPAPLPAAPPPAVGAIAGQAQKPGAVAESVLLKRDGAIAAPALFATPESSTMYRILNGRDIQRSQDSGATWTTQTTVADVQLSSGACPTTTACWVVGSGGGVFRTIDGRSWQRIPFAESTDLVLVTASNPDTVVVTAKDGRRFSTRDGGKTWVSEK